MNQEGIRIIALYLPQFHPIPENDVWWGKGFTEWTNVGKAKPLFRGHYQPRIPADLGYYDLRVPETREAQANLAKEYGIEGFCYWHYWFGKGKRLLERPFNEVLVSGRPDFPFCLGWANHSWYEKLWTVGSKNKLLIEQLYPGEQDYKDHFYEVLPAMLDKRYITVEGKPFFLIFSPLDSPEITTFINVWRKEARINGLKDIFFVGQGLRGQKRRILDIGFDAYNDNSVTEIYTRKRKHQKIIEKIKALVFGTGRVYDYKDASKYFCTEDAKNVDTIPIICPNWDHSPRSGNKAIIFKNSTPRLFGQHVLNVFSYIKEKPSQHRLVILKSWNEWGECNYIEPDIKFGTKYLEELKNAIHLMK